MVTAFGYALGIHAPGRELMLGALPTAHHQLLGHGLATSALRAAGARQVAITNNYSPAWPATTTRRTWPPREAYDTLHNRMFTDPVLLGRYPDLSAFGVGPDGLDCVLDGDLAVISAPLDALGVNYYNPTRLSALPDSPLPFQMEPIPGYPVTAFGWPVIPAGLTELLTAARRALRRPAAADLHHRERLLGRGRGRPATAPSTTSPGSGTWTATSGRCTTR